MVPGIGVNDYFVWPDLDHMFCGTRLLFVFLACFVPNAVSFYECPALSNCSERRIFNFKSKEVNLFS